MHRHLVGAVILLALSGSLPAEEYLGATGVLEKLHMPAEGSPDDPARLIQSRIVAFQLESAKLAPEEAARKWLDLFDAYADLRNTSSLGARRGRLELSSLIAALPPSHAWDALAKAVAARDDGKNPRRQVALELLARILTGRPEDPKETLALAKSVLQSPGGLRRMFGAHDYSADALAKLAAALQQRSGKTARSPELIKQQVAAADKGDDLELPRGISQLPEGEALLVQALQKELDLEFPDETTRRWAAAIVKARPDILRSPQWSLVASADDLPLYELMRQRFPKSENPWESREAGQIYLAAQIAAGHHAEARKQVLRSLADGNQANLPATDRIGADGGKKLRAFLEELLSAAPALPLWGEYLRLSATTGKSKEASAFLQKLHDQAKPESRTRRVLEDHLPQALLAAGSVEAGVAKLRARIAAKPPENATMNAEELTAMQRQLAELGFDATPEQMAKLAAEDSDDAAREAIASALQLAELGRLLQRPEWVGEGLAQAIKSADLEDDTWGYTSSQIVTALLKHGCGAEAESLIAKTLRKMNRDENRSFSYGIRRTLGELVAVYRHAGRFDDIVTLLDRCELWGARDLADLNDVEAGEVPLQLAAAEAFSRQGKKDLALELVRRVMRQHSGKDDAYELRLAIGGPDVEADLDQVFALNRFQERPLIWKAKHQLDAGRVADAEKTIRAAIAIDPSDGEEGKGDRMRAYAVLADVLEKKGDQAQAKIMRGAVRAVRLSEDADDWWNAGLLSRAVAMYEEALTHFADAYCIQSRLALRYSELGDLAKAEKHYQRAFELMPDSFGRIESHCFGCEGIFNGATSQNVADRIFTRLAKERPESPQVFYLLGYLRQNQKRPEEAVAAFRRAVELDPDYVNAWKKLSELAEQSADLAKERDEAALALFRLTREEQAIRHVSDLPRLWDAILQAEAALSPPLKGPVYRLPAVAKEDDSERRFYFSPNDDPSLTPRERLASNSIVTNVLEVMKFLLAKP